MDGVSTKLAEWGLDMREMGKVRAILTNDENLN
jgi:hypothetical protein